MPDQLRKCSKCNEYSVLWNESSCSHCGEEFDEEELPSAEKAATFFEQFRPSIPEEVIAQRHAEEERNVEWAKNLERQQSEDTSPEEQGSIEDSGKFFDWHGALQFPSIFCGLYTNEFAEHELYVQFFAGFGVSLLLGFFFWQIFPFRSKKRQEMSSMVTSIVCWAWFYYWAGYESNLTQAAVGPLLFFFTVGRMLTWAALAKKSK